jgi:hypothetical protein
MRPRADSCPWTHQVMRPRFFVSMPLLPSIGMWPRTLSRNYEVLSGGPASDRGSRRAIVWAAGRGRRGAVRAQGENSTQIEELHHDRLEAVPFSYSRVAQVSPIQLIACKPITDLLDS